MRIYRSARIATGRFRVSRRFWRAPSMAGAAAKGMRRRPTFLTGIAMPFGEKIVCFLLGSKFSVAFGF
jgi:hypothetical protein